MVKRLLGIFLVGLSITCVRADRDDLYKRTFNGTYSITSRVDVVIQGAGTVDLLICLPYPEDNRYQDIVYRTIYPDGIISFFPETEKPFLKYARLGKNMGNLSITNEYVVSLYKVEFDWSKVREIYPYDMDSAEYKMYTRQQVASDQNSITVHTSHPWVQAQKNFIRASSKDDILKYIFNAYRTVTTNFHYGTVSSFDEAINEKRGDCGRLSSIFVSLLRANAIPARQMVCMRPDGSPHVWAEFYLEKYGWIPADPTFDLGKSDNFDNLGKYNDSCIVMTSDSDMSTETLGGVNIESFGIQGISWWWWWYGEKTDIQLEYTFGGEQGMIDENEKFISFKELWKGWGGYEANNVYTFDCNLRDDGNSNIGLTGGYFDFEASPLGTALKSSELYGPWVCRDIQLSDEWTILTTAKVSATNDAVVFSMGGSGSRFGLALTSCGKDKVALSFWEPYGRHQDLIVANIPMSSEEYNIYAFRVSKMNIEMFVNGSFVGAGKLKVIPVGALQFFGVIWGEGDTGLKLAKDSVVDDWRLYNCFIPDADIKNYVDVSSKHIISSSLSRMADVKLKTNITNIMQYVAYNEWVRFVTNDVTSFQKLKESTKTWYSYALGLSALMDNHILSDDLKIKSFVHTHVNDVFEFAVKLDGITVGENAREANLKKVFDIEGAETLATGGAGFSSDNVEVNAAAPENGNVKFTVTPKMENGEKPDSFFFRVKMKQ